MGDLVVKHQRQAGDAQHEQKHRTNETGPFVEEVPVFETVDRQRHPMLPVGEMRGT